MTLRSADLAFLVVMGLTVLGVVGGTAHIIQRLQATAIEEALGQSAMHARAFEDHLTRSLGAVTSLANLAAASPVELKRDHIGELFSRSLRHAPFLRSLSVLDNGRITASSNPANVGRAIEVDGYLPDTTSADHLRIGRPWAGRDFNEGRPTQETDPVPPRELSFIPVMHRVAHNGEWVTLVAAVNPDFFINYFTSRLEPEAGFVQVLRYDLAILLDTSDTLAAGSKHPDPSLRQRLQESEYGRFDDPAEQTFTAYRATRDYPLLVVVRLDRSQALAPWQNESRRLVLLVGPGLLAMIVLSTALHQRQQRIAAQQVEARQREHERLAATVFDTVAEAVMVTGSDRRILAVNPAFARITGYSPAEVIGHSPQVLSGETHPEEFFQSLDQTLALQGHWEGEIRYRRKSGEMFVAWQSISLVRDEAGRITHLVSGFTDFTEHRAEADRNQHLAHHDMLTGLPNRTLFLDRLRQSMSIARRQGHRLGLLFLDLDKFKPVNDRFGHAIGDLLLKQVADRMLQQVRASDTVVRLGGDEFVILLPSIDNEHSALAVAEKIRRALQLPFPLAGHSLSISSSCGIAIFPEDGEDEAQLMRHADAAMYQAKHSGGNRLSCHRPELTYADAAAPLEANG